MRTFALIAITISSILVMSFENDTVTDPSPEEIRFAIVIHGGAGSIKPGILSPEEEQVRKDLLT